MKKSKGSAIVMTIIIMTIFTLLGTVILQIYLFNTKQVVYQEGKTKAYYNAYSGANAMASYLIDNPNDAADIVSKTKFVPGNGSFDGNNFEVTVSNGVTDELIIQSKGIVSGVSPVTVKLSLKLVDSALFKNALFADKKLDISGNSKIKGDIGTNDSNVTLGSNFSGNVTVGPDTSDDTISSIQSQLEAGKTVTKLTSKIEFPQIDESKFPSENNYTSGTDIALNNGEIKYLRIDDLDKGMNVTGNGELHMLVTNSFEFKGNDSITTPGNTAKVYIYYAGNSISFKGTPSFRGMIYAPNADMECKGGGNGDFIGCIICKSYKGPKSAASSITVDPDLLVKDLALTGARIYKRINWSD